MSKETDFLELSALLTGLPQILAEPKEGTLNLNKPMAEEYERRLDAVFPDQLKSLLQAYATLASVTPKPPINDALFAKFKATPEFQKVENEFVARQIVNIWYYSQFKDKPDATEFLDGGFYERGAIWPLIKAHPIGFSNQPYGYWTVQP